MVAQLMLSTLPDALEHLKETRTFFERGMVRKAAELASAEDVAELRAIVEQQRAVTGDAAAFVHADMGFHTRIAQITGNPIRSEEHTSELQSLMRTSYAVFCLKKKTTK